MHINHFETKAREIVRVLVQYMHMTDVSRHRPSVAIGARVNDLSKGQMRGLQRHRECGTASRTIFKLLRQSKHLRYVQYLLQDFWIRGTYQERLEEFPGEYVVIVSVDGHGRRNER